MAALNIAIDGNIRWRIRQKRDYYVIDEIVSSNGMYITWPMIHGTIEGAKETIQKELGVRFKERDE